MTSTAEMVPMKAVSVLRLRLTDLVLYRLMYLLSGNIILTYIVYLCYIKSMCLCTQKALFEIELMPVSAQRSQSI